MGSRAGRIVASFSPSAANSQQADGWGVVRSLALNHLDRFMSLQPNVLRGDDPEAIHDVRVASRRFQQVLDLLYPAPRPNKVRQARRVIRRCRRELSEVRNCDVLLQRVERTLRRKRVAQRPAWDAVRDHFRERRTAEFETATEGLARRKLNKVYVRLQRAVAAALKPADSAAGNGAPGEVSFSTRIVESLEKVWQEFQTQVTQSHRQPGPEVLHAVRIAAKRLRYQVEVIAAFKAPGSEETLNWLRQLQQHLGDWHDLEVMELAMADAVARPKFVREHVETAMGIEKLILQNRRRKRGFEEKYFQMTLDSPGWLRLQEWVGQVLSAPATALTRL